MGDMGRPRTLTPAQEDELVAMANLGIKRETAARALQVSVRTVGRVLARDRARTTPMTLEDALAPFTDGRFELFPPAAPPRPRERPRRRGRSEWERAAEHLEAVAPERWRLPGADDAA
jgi:hypothetical protein